MDDIFRGGESSDQIKLSGTNKVVHLNFDELHFAFRFTALKDEICLA